MNRRIKLLLFGASEGGLKMLRRLSRFEEVVGFLDNDPSKQGGRLKGYPIHDPRRARELGFDYVLISSMHYEAIEKQLLDLGIEGDRILTPQSLEASEAFPWDGLVYLLLFLLVGAGAVVGLLALLT